MKIRFQCSREQCDRIDGPFEIPGWQSLAGKQDLFDLTVPQGAVYTGKSQLAILFRHHQLRGQVGQQTDAKYDATSKDPQPFAHDAHKKTR